MDDDDLFATFMSQYADNPYTDDLGTPLEQVDNETAKFYRQQGLAQSGESPLAGMGPGAGTFDLTEINTQGFSNLLKGLGGTAKDFLTSKAGMAGLLALLNYLDRQKPTARGGGTSLAYTGPAKPLTATTVQGKYGPLVTYAANGGLMQAYANGGKVQMEDGGFVMTKKAVDGAGGPQGLTQLLPDARMIRGPGTGTSDDIPAVINGRNGQTPARLSNGEAYVPPGRDTKGLYALMHRLERNA